MDSQTSASDGWGFSATEFVIRYTPRHVLPRDMEVNKMSQSTNGKRFRLLNAIGILILLLILLLIFQGIIWVVHSYWNTFLTQWKEKPVQMVLSGFVLVVALALAMIKRWDLQFYALIEISFGLNVLWESADRILENPGNQTLVLASAYLLARGFNNLFDSWKKKENRSDHPVLEERT